MATVTVRQLIIDARRQLAAQQIEDASFNADCLAARVLGISNGSLPRFWETPATEQFRREFASLLHRRCQHEPLQYLVGEWGFLDFEVQVGPGALIPRPETEEVFLAAARAIDDRPYKNSFRFADIGTGTGILGIAMARRFPGATGLLVDLSVAALALAQLNLKKFPGVEGRLVLQRGDLLGAFADASLHVIIANPPYVVSEDIQNLQPEVGRFEPEMALDGGPHGIELIERLLVEAWRVLLPGGLLVFEHGHGQRQELLKLTAGGWQLLQAGDDLCGRQRYLVLERI